jgi:PBSX family phage terminase large subunit
LSESHFEAHGEKQFQAFSSNADITILGTGIQWGKTETGAVWIRRQIHTYTDPKDTFLITSPNYKTLQQSTLGPFLRVMKGLGTYHKTDSCFVTHWGTHIWIRTATEPDSVVGIANVRAIWGDEAGKYSLYFWENMEGRAAPRNARILLTTSPYSLNWIWKDLIKPAKEGKRPDVTYISAHSSENPYFNQEVYEKRRLTMDPRRFAMMYGGEWGRMSGLVYDAWDPTLNLVSPFELPSGTRFFGGIDWGHTEPFVLVVRAVTPDGRHYQVSEFYKSGLTITDMIQIAKQKKQTYGIIRFYCGPDQPGYIEEFNRNALPAQGADNDVRRGLDLHYELIKTRRYKIFEQSSPHTLDELDTYHYPESEDLGPDQSSKELKPVGQNDHALDANRYCTIETYRSQLKLIPKVPGETPKPKDPVERLAFLKKRKASRQSEVWD